MNLTNQDSQRPSTRAQMAERQKLDRILEKNNF
jgi:hypothetical protein